MTPLDATTTAASDSGKTVEELPPRFTFPKWTSVAIAVLLLGLAVNGLIRMDISWERMAEGPANIWDFVTGAFPPNLERAPNLAEAMLETLEMAIIGTAIGVLLSVPAAVLAAQNTTPFGPRGRSEERRVGIEGRYGG